MGAEIYADVLFLVNFIMNFFVLCIAGKIMRKKIKYIRIGAGAAFSALLYCVIVFVLPFNIYINIAAALLILSAGVFIAFSPIQTGIRQFLYLMLASWAATLLLGGAAFVVYFLVSSPYSLASTNMGNGFSLTLLLTSSVCVYIALKLLMRRLQKSHIQRQTFYNYRIWLNNLTTDVKGLVDTGNCLREPISQSPVVVTEAALLKSVLPECINTLFLEKKEDDLQHVLTEFTQGGLSTRIRFIPYTSAGGTPGVFIGFKPDKIELTTSNGTLTIMDVIIGICNFKLSPNGDYHALLNPAIFN